MSAYDLDPRYEQRVKWPKMNVNPSLASGDLFANDAGKLAVRLFPELSADEHAAIGARMLADSERLGREQSALIDEWDERDGKKGVFRPFISGGFQEHWPEDVKGAIRDRSRTKSRMKSIGIAHIAAAKYLRRTQRRRA